MRKEVDFEKWCMDKFSTDPSTLIQVLEMSPSSQGYIHGAVSELELMNYLEDCGYKVYRIKEKPSGGFDEKKVGYKGDFLIQDKNGLYYVVECKGIKTNAEFRSGDTDDEFAKSITREQAINFLKKYINIDKQKIWQKGYKAYCKMKDEWEIKNPGKTYPPFRWKVETAGPDSADLTSVFPTLRDIQEYVYSLDENKFTEQAFRHKEGVYVVMQTHKPSGRTDPETGEHIAAPLVSDFSILAVDLYQRLGKHKFVFVNPDTISHSPDHPGHLYQNYIIDIIVPGRKDNLTIRYPWFEDIKECIKKTSPRTVEYDESQLDHREAD